MNEIVPAKTLVKHGSKALGGIAGGGALLVLNGIAAAPVAGLVVGGILTIGGLGIGASSKDDRVAGAVTAGAGVLTALTAIPLVGPLASGLLSLAGVGLLIGGGVSLYKFWKGLKSRR
jgi:hypothetical protein